MELARRCTKLISDVSGLSDFCLILRCMCGTVRSQSQRAEEETLKSSNKTQQIMELSLEILGDSPKVTQTGNFCGGRSPCSSAKILSLLNFAVTLAWNHKASNFRAYSTENPKPFTICIMMWFVLRRSLSKWMIFSSSGTFAKSGECNSFFQTRKMSTPTCTCIYNLGFTDYWTVRWGLWTRWWWWY